MGVDDALEIASRAQFSRLGCEKWLETGANRGEMPSPVSRSDDHCRRGCDRQARGFVAAVGGVLVTRTGECGVVCAGSLPWPEAR